jgi:light-independent protochlorophyllide reductase subunit B
LEEHLLTMFREDFEFHDEAGPSHHGGKADLREVPADSVTEAPAVAEDASGGSISERAMQGSAVWSALAERELRKVPFFVRGKAKRNTEKFAAEKGVAEISVETLYEAKAHYAR